MGTWILFAAVSSMTDVRDKLFLAPLVFPVLALALVLSLIYYDKARRELPGHGSRRLAVACQISLFLIYYTLKRYSSFDPSVEHFLLAIYMLFTLHVSRRFAGVDAFSGPALLVLGLTGGLGGTDLHLYLFTFLVLLATALLGIRTRRVGSLVTPILGAFFLVLGSTIELGLITAAIAVAGLLVLYASYRLVMLARKVSQFSSFLVDLAAAPGVVLLARSLLAGPLPVAAFLVQFYAIKLIVLLAFTSVLAGRQAARAGSLRAVFRGEMKSQRSIRYNNLWFSLISSASAVGLSFMHYVFVAEYSLQKQIALLALTGFALHASSWAFNRTFLAGIGAFKGQGKVSIGRRFDSKLLRISALSVLAASMFATLGGLDASSFSSQVYAKAAKLYEEKSFGEVIRYIHTAWQDAGQRSLNLETPELAIVFVLFSLTFAVLLVISDGELDRPPFFFFRGLVPFKSLLSARAMRDQASRLLFNAPFIGPFAKGFNALLEHILRSFDDEARFSVGKLFIIVGSIVFFVGAEDFVDRVVLVLGTALEPKFATAFAPDYLGQEDFIAKSLLDGAKDLVAWNSCLSSSVLAVVLFALGAMLHRSYLRTTAIVIGLCFLGFNFFRLGEISLSFPVVCASVLIGTCFLLQVRGEKDVAVEGRKTKRSVGRSPGAGKERPIVPITAAGDLLLRERTVSDESAGG